MNESVTTSRKAAVARGLATSEVATVAEAAGALDGDWTATTFECVCCGRTAAEITCEAVAGPTFEITRDDDDKVLLTTTWLDGEDYLAEFWSLPEALNAMRATISRSAEASRATEVRAKAEA
jgi:hypothetical protein